MASVSTPKDHKELYALKQRAMKYYQENGVPLKMEQILNSMFYDDPQDVYGHLVNFFDQFTKPATIQKVTAQQAVDSLCQPTVQCNVYCTINNKEKLTNCISIANANLKVRPEEREKAELDNQESVKCAIKIINEELCDTLTGMDPLKLSEIDALVLDIVEKKKEEDLIRKAKEEENHEETPPPVVDEKDKKKSAKKPKEQKPRESFDEEKPGKGSMAVDVIPEKTAEYFTPGSDIVSAISQSVCACAAITSRIPLYRHIANIARCQGAVNEFRIPLPMVTIVQSGGLGTGKVKCIKEYMIVPGHELSIEKSIGHIQNIFNYVARCFAQKLGITAKYVNEIGTLCPPVDSPTQILDLLQEAVNGEGLTIGEDIFLAINAAGQECFDYERGKYETVQGTFKSGDEMVEFWADIVNKYPSICAIIDPMRSQEIESWMKLCERVSERVFIIGDHFYDRPGLLCKMDMPDPVPTSVIQLTLEHMNSVTDVIQCANMFKEAKNELVIAASQVDTTDTFIVDMAVGLNARFFKLGGPCRGEKTAKLNRLTQIQSELEPAVPVSEDEEAQAEVIYQIEGECDEPETVLEEKEKTWGHDENNRLKLHEHFFFPLIQNKPEEEEQEEPTEENSEEKL